MGSKQSPSSVGIHESGRNFASSISDDERIHHSVNSNPSLFHDVLTSCNQQVLVDTMLNTALCTSPASSITSLLLFGPQAGIITDKALSKMSDFSPDQETHFASSSKDEATMFPSQSPNDFLHIIALRNAICLLKRSQEDLSSSSIDHSFVYRELTTQLQDIGNLLAICSEPAISYSIADVSQLLLLSIHMLAIRESGLLNIAEEDILPSLTHLCGALFSSHRGIQEMMSAFEDIRLEKAWWCCLLGDALVEHDLIAQLRCSSGVLSLAEEIQKASFDMDIFPSLTLSKLEIGVITATLLDSWRTSQIILQLQLGDMENIRHHSETVSNACIDLAKLCAYDSGREVGILSLTH